MYLCELLESERNLLHKIADFLFELRKINELIYLSDGKNNTGIVGFFYRPNMPQNNGQIYYVASFTGTGLHIESEQTTDISDDLKKYVKSKFPNAKYLRGKNWHHWCGVYLTDLLVHNY